VLASKRTGIALLGLALALALALSLCWATVGAAKKHRGIKTSVTLKHPSDTQFSGSVKSRLSGCRKQRLVNLYYIDPTTGQTQPLAVDRTNKKGKYRMDLSKSPFGGKYYAQAPKVKKRGVQQCRAGKSKKVVIPTAPLTP
jgi:hypothetical protein